MQVPRHFILDPQSMINYSHPARVAYFNSFVAGLPGPLHFSSGQLHHSMLFHRTNTL